MLGIKMAKEMFKAAKKRFHEVSIHKNEPKVICTQIAQKQKSELTKLVYSVKKRRYTFFKRFQKKIKMG